LPSKVRYISAQFLALLQDDLWLDNARCANDLAVVLYEAVRDIPALEVDPPAVNSLFPVLPRQLARSLQEWSFFYDWDQARQQVRWMTSWDTTRADVDSFVAGLRYFAAQEGSAKDGVRT
jgi:threonine aldolase